MVKPSSANYVRREVAIVEAISGEPLNIVGETLIKSTDRGTTAAISAVEPFTRKGRTFYKVEFFVNNNGFPSVEGNFTITPNTRLIENASVGDTILTVDSTLSFSESGTLISGSNTISYTGKSINQFFGCTGITANISATSSIRSSDSYFSYENGDTNKKVEVLILGVITDLKEDSEDFKVSEGDVISIKSLGDKIKNTNSNWKEIFANSLIYNTSTRHEVIDNNRNELASVIDRSSLKPGDEVEILSRGTETVVTTSSPTYIESVDAAQNTLTLQNLPVGFTTSTELYDIRRKLNKTQSSGSEFESDTLLSDVLNLYVDRDEYAYIASNSLPSRVRNFTVNDYRFDVQENVKSVEINSIAGLGDLANDVYNSFVSTNIPFITGDVVYYSSQEEPLAGLTTGTYFVQKVANNKFKLYGSQSLIGTENNITFALPVSGISTHNFVLNSQKGSELGIQKLLRKFPLEKNIKTGSGQLTSPGNTGMLINGVEIHNYKSSDVVYYGPIKDVDILSGGDGYDVINPPIIEVSDDNGSGAKIQPVISGKFEKSL